MTTTAVTVHAEPAPMRLELRSTALMIVDMQRDFLEPGGFGAALGNDVARLAAVVAPTRRVLDRVRACGVMVVHTREGHRADLSDVPKAKLEKGESGRRIGDVGPLGRLLIRGEAGHDIVPALEPLAGEPIVDKPGKGAFHATELDLLLRNARIDTLLVAGVTTEICVHTTVREANDRGYRCLVLADCCGSYFPEFHDVGLRMISAQNGLLGSVTRSSALCDALDAV